jgi:hypothetical protein
LPSEIAKTFEAFDRLASAQRNERESLDYHIARLKSAIATKRNPDTSEPLDEEILQNVRATLKTFEKRRSELN